MSNLPPRLFTSSLFIASAVACLGGSFSAACSDLAGPAEDSPDASTEPGADAMENPDAAPPVDRHVERGLFVNGEERTGPVGWMSVADDGPGEKIELATEVAADERRSVWGFSDDGKWLFYTVGFEDDVEVHASYLGAEAQRVDDGSKDSWYYLTWNEDRLFFVGESEVGFGARLGEDGIVAPSEQYSREGKRVFGVVPAPSGDYVSMHYYGFQDPIVRVIQDVDQPGVDKRECCSFDYYWNLAPHWAHTVDRQLIVAGPQYEDRDLYVIGAEESEPTPVHTVDDDGGRRVDGTYWSPDDQLVAYQVKMTIENFSDHLFIADVSGAPERVEATFDHTAGVSWRPGANSRQLTYLEYPTYKSQQRLMLGKIGTSPLSFESEPLIEYEPSPIFGILYQWNADGTAILHHGGAAGEYAVTFVDGAGTPSTVALGIYFREEDAENDWSIPHISWSKDGRWLLCRTNTGYTVASIDVDSQTVGELHELPADTDFAWWDRRYLAE